MNHSHIEPRLDAGRSRNADRPQLSIGGMFRAVSFVSVWLTFNLWLSHPWGAHWQVPLVNVGVTITVALTFTSSEHQFKTMLVSVLALVLAFCVDLSYWLGLPRFYEVGPSHFIPVSDRILLSYGLKYMVAILLLVTMQAALRKIDWLKKSTHS